MSQKPANVLQSNLTLPKHSADIHQAEVEEMADAERPMTRWHALLGLFQFVLLCVVILMEGSFCSPQAKMASMSGCTAGEKRSF
jgi:hypothetical protein